MSADDVTRPANSLRIARARAGLNMTEVAKACDVARNTYWRWETGKSPVTVEKLPILSELFGVSREYLIGWRPTSEEFAELERKGAA